MIQSLGTVNRLPSTTRIRRALLSTCLAAATGCGGGGTEPPPPPPPNNGYTIDFRWVGTPPSVAIAQAFSDAATRISTIIVGDLPNAQIGTSSTPFDIVQCTGAFAGVTPLNELVDDIVIFASVDSIDGVGRVLGSAGPCLTRTTGGLTGLGTMRFDSADLQNLANSGRLGDVILHEMLHVIGIGTLWSARSLLVDVDSATVRVTGTRATAACANELGGSAVCVGAVPAENCLDLAVSVVCGAGTRNAHWKESTFRTELMTGYAGATNPLSRMTIQGLADLGYTVNLSVADAYTVPALLMASSRAAQAEFFVTEETVLPAPSQPRFALYPDGRVRRLLR